MTETILSFLAAGTFFLLPVIIGTLFRRPKVWTLPYFINNFVLGSLLVFIFYLVSHFFGNLQLWFILLALISTIVLAFRKPFTFRLSFPHLLLAVIALSLYFFIWRANTPIPGVVNWDFLHHSILVNHLVSGQFSFLLTDFSDTFTFNSYSPIFYILVAVPKLIFNVPALSLFWAIEPIYFLLSIAVSAWIANKAYPGPLSTFIGGIVGIFVFESSVAYTNLFFLPQTLTGTLGAFLITNYLFRDQSDDAPAWSFVLGLLLCLIMHYIVGFAVVAAFGALVLAKFLAPKVRYFTPFLVVLALLLIVTSLLLGLNNSIVLTDRAEARDFVFTSIQKLNYFFSWWGLVGFTGLFIGIVALFNQKSIQARLFLAFTLGLLGVALFPLSYALKFYVLGHYFVNAVIASGIIAVVMFLRLKWLQYIMIALATLALAAVFLNTTLDYLETSLNKDSNSYISAPEFSTSQWLRQNYDPATTFLVSDSATQAVFEATTGINTQGGGFPRSDTVITLSSLKDETRPEIFAQKILSIHDTILAQDFRQKTLFVASGRYFTWQNFTDNQKLSYFYQVWSAQELGGIDKLKISNLANSPLFKLVYQDNQDAIFEVNNP